MSAKMSRGWPTELARTIYGRRDALAKYADFPVWEKGFNVTLSHRSPNRLSNIAVE